MRRPVIITDEGAQDYGITSEHWPILQSAVSELNIVLLIRAGKPKSVPWIRKKFLAKPKELAAITTDPDVGLLVAKDGKDESAAKSSGYGIVKKKGSQWIVELAAPPAGGPPALPEDVLRDLGSSVREGIVVDATSFRPVTSDYDLAAIIFLDAGKRGLTKMAVLEGGGGEATPRTTTVTRSADGIPTITGGKAKPPLGKRASFKRRIESGNNFSNGPIEEVIEALNLALGDKRIMHGPVANLDGNPAMDDEKLVVIFPRQQSELITSRSRWKAGTELNDLLDELGV